jgi:hypothetical protein
VEKEPTEKMHSVPFKNINQVMSKKKQARKIIAYLISIVAPAKTNKGIAKQGHAALAKFKNHFPELVKYL